MAGFSDYLETALLNLTLRQTAFTAPATIYVALHTADPGDTGASEVAAGWYARVASGAFAAPSGGASSNSSTITFNAVTGAGVTITHVSLWDASTAGNCLYADALSSSKTLAVSDVLSFAAGTITVTLA
jgi:hypothetical protein